MNNNIIRINYYWIYIKKKITHSHVFGHSMLPVSYAFIKYNKKLQRCTVLRMSSFTDK